MNFRIIIFGLIMMTCVKGVTSQTDSDSVVNLIKDSCINFLVKRNELKDTNSMEYYNRSILIVEMVKIRPLGFDETGIYILGTNTSHSHSYLLLKSGSAFKILLFEDLPSTLNDAISFLLEHDISCDQIILYVVAINTHYKAHNGGNYVRIYDD